MQDWEQNLEHHAQTRFIFICWGWGECFRCFPPEQNANDPFNKMGKLLPIHKCGRCRQHLLQAIIRWLRSFLNQTIHLPIDSRSLCMLQHIPSPQLSKIIWQYTIIHIGCSETWSNIQTIAGTCNVACVSVPIYLQILGFLIRELQHIFFIPIALKTFKNILNKLRFWMLQK